MTYHLYFISQFEPTLSFYRNLAGDIIYYALLRNFDENHNLPYNFFMLAHIKMSAFIEDLERDKETLPETI